MVRLDFGGLTAENDDPICLVRILRTIVRKVRTKSARKAGLNLVGQSQQCQLALASAKLRQD